MPTAEDFSNFGEIEVQKMSKIQKYALTNLTNAWNSIPHVTHFDEADITNINIARKEIGISPLAYIIESVCKNLKKFPKFNSSLLKNNELAIKNYINVGIAVDTPEGLVVPVIKDANMLDVKELDSKVKELAEKALSKKLLTQDYHGATFTISSLGKIGGTGFTPIINPPEVAILGISRSRKALNIQNGQIVERDILPMSLSYDHRVINGADAGKFMESFTNILEETYK